MSLTYSSATINGRLGVVITNIDAGAGFGVMRLLDATSQTVGLVTLLKPCATVSNTLLTFSGLPLAAPLTLLSGQIVSADIEDSNGNVVVSGLLVGPSTGYDIYMANPFVSSGQIVTLTYATIQGR